MTPKSLYPQVLERQDILDSIERIRRYTEHLSSSDFLANGVVQDAVIRRIEIIGEAVGYLPEELKERRSDVPWQDIKAMRNKLIPRWNLRYDRCLRPCRTAGSANPKAS